MSKYVVIKPLARMTKTNGFETFTHGDLIDLEDKKEAAEMAEAGIIEPEPVEAERSEAFETAVQSAEGVERAVKRGRKEG